MAAYDGTQYREFDITKFRIGGLAFLSNNAEHPTIEHDDIWRGAYINNVRDWPDNGFRMPFGRSIQGELLTTFTKYPENKDNGEDKNYSYGDPTISGPYAVIAIADNGTARTLPFRVDPDPAPPCVSTTEGIYFVRSGVLYRYANGVSKSTGIHPSSACSFKILPAGILVLRAAERGCQIRLIPQVK
ncbi:MAG TPA: hypothetical protein VGL56_10115 [Fimbriimonadaceae bacterium]